MSQARRSAVVIACLLLATFIAPTTGQAFHGQHDHDCYKLTDDEQDLARRINQMRKRNDMGKMHLDPELSKVATKNSDKMADQGALQHTGLDTLNHRITKEVSRGETVVAADSTKAMMRLIRGSSTHRDLVLGSFEHFGVGIVKGHGSKWATVVFAGHKNPGTTLNMPNC